ncbi:MAG: hypothetical protein ACK41U_16430 [Paracoccus sp. (in: a-proteobacteria)]
MIAIFRPGPRSTDTAPRTAPPTDTPVRIATDRGTMNGWPIIRLTPTGI